MYDEKPSTAYGLSLVGGIFILLGGIVFMLLGTGFGYYYWYGTFILLIMGVVGLVMGIIVVIGAISAYNDPKSRQAWGAAILVMAIISLFVAAGGFIVGFILALIGGILFMTWKPTLHPYMPSKMCMGCGRYIASSYTICPYCGTQAPPPTLYQPYYQYPYPYPPQQAPPPVHYPQQYRTPPPVAPPPPEAPAQPPPVIPAPPAQPPEPAPARTETPCSSCGFTLPSSVRFCPKCGTKVAQ